jgi:hypothetical protein
MSTTFQPTPGNPTGFKVGCTCDNNRGPVFGNYADAAEWYEANNCLHGPVPAEALVGCEDVEYCSMGSIFIQAQFAEVAPSLNVSNGNAVVILEALGMAPEVIDTEFGPCTADAYGSMSADDFLGRVLAAEVMSVGDPGTETEVLAEEGKATFVMCGRREGYVDEKLSVLREIALWAQAHQVEVQWA